MLDPLQFYCRVLCNGMKTRFRMVMIAHPGPGIGFHKRFMWQIIIPPTTVIKESLTWVGRLSATILAMLRSNLRWAVLQHAYPLGLWHPTMDVHCQRSRVTCYPLDQNKAHSSAPHLHLLPILPIWYALQVPILVVVTDVHSLVSYNTIHACTLAVWPLAARSIQFTSYSLGPIM